MVLASLKEWKRERATRALQVLGSPRERVFDEFVDRAAAAFNTPLSFLSIVSGDRQWFKSGHGSDLAFTPRSASFCAHALGGNDLLEVCEPLADQRFADNPLVVGQPGIRYYLGAPLRLTSGHDVGALCVIDQVRRAPASEEQRAYLRALARQAALALELRAEDERRSI